MERAAGRRIGRIGDFAPGRADLIAQRRIGFRDRRQQRLGVGMARSRVERRGRRGLDDAPDIHHGDAVADMAHHAEIMRDEQHRQPQPVLQVEQQIDDLGLHGNIERGYRLVGDHQRRIERQRARNADALALAAAEGMRKPRSRRGRQADEIEQLAHPLRGAAPPARR